MRNIQGNPPSPARASHQESLCHTKQQNPPDNLEKKHLATTFFSCTVEELFGCGAPIVTWLFFFQCVNPFLSLIHFDSKRFCVVFFSNDFVKFKASQFRHQSSFFHHQKRIPHFL